MDDNSWRGHNFTLLIFGGVVVLCSIFFILGMMVGRAQVPAVSEVRAVTDDTFPEDEIEDLDLRFYEAVEESEPPPFEASVPEAGSSADAVAANQPPPITAPPLAAAPAPEVGIAITLQIAALSSSGQG